MNTLSWIIILVPAITAAIGYRRGIVREAVSLCAVVSAVICCRIFGDYGAEFMASLMGIDGETTAVPRYVASFSGYGLIFITVWLCVWFVGRMLRGAVHAVKLGVIDSLFGAVYCSAKWFLIMGLSLDLLFLISPHAGFWGGAPPGGIVQFALDFPPMLLGILKESVS